MEGCKAGWKDGWLDGRKDGWMEGRMDVKMTISIPSFDDQNFMIKMWKIILFTFSPVFLSPI